MAKRCLQILIIPYHPFYTNLLQVVELDNTEKDVSESDAADRDYDDDTIDVTVSWLVEIALIYGSY